jgi:hypothetical protein
MGFQMKKPVEAKKVITGFSIERRKRIDARAKELVKASGDGSHLLVTFPEGEKAEFDRGGTE